MNELGTSCDQDRYKLFWYSWLSVNRLDTSCEKDGHEVGRKTI
jgi:hypothetical protein